MNGDDDSAQRRLHHLEQRYRRAQSALAAPRAHYASMRELPEIKELQLHQAFLKVQRARQQLSDLESAIDLLEGHS